MFTRISYSRTEATLNTRRHFTTGAYFLTELFVALYLTEVFHVPVEADAVRVAGLHGGYDDEVDEVLEGE